MVCCPFRKEEKEASEPAKLVVWEQTSSLWPTGKLAAASEWRGLSVATAAAALDSSYPKTDHFGAWILKCLRW